MRRPWRAAVVSITVLSAGLLLVGVLLPRFGGEGQHGAGLAAQASVTRPPAVAGTFYPADRDQLQEEVERYLKQADAPEGLPGELVALIVPHAGYVYSGPVAAHAYRHLRGKHFDTVAVIGSSHSAAFAGIALSGAAEWATPMGAVAIDRAGSEALLNAGVGAHILDAAHVREHSIEMQVPFLQATLKDFKLLPVLMGDAGSRSCEALARALADYARGRSVLLVASSDMSHYPSYDDAVRVDHTTLEAISSGDADRVEAATRVLMSQGVPNLVTCLCGEGPVKTTLMAAHLLGADQFPTLKYANSGDVPGAARDRVVGYCAVAACRTGSSSGSPLAASAGELSAEQQQHLLSLARSAIEEYVRTGRAAAIAETDQALLRPGAAFVTLRRQGQLRGCIGSLEATAPLAETVRDRAIHAATRDPRFPPVSAAELPDLEIEISVLSPLRAVAGADEIELGRHGVVVRSNRRSGVFLPQVAEETGWSRDEFLTHLCRDKAGLPADAWKRGADLYVFTVQAFSSSAPSERSDVGR